MLHGARALITAPRVQLGCPGSREKPWHGTGQTKSARCRSVPDNAIPLAGAQTRARSGLNGVPQPFRMLPSQTRGSSSRFTTRQSQRCSLHNVWSGLPNPASWERSAHLLHVGCYPLLFEPSDSQATCGFYLAVLIFCACDIYYRIVYASFFYYRPLYTFLQYAALRRDRSRRAAQSPASVDAVCFMMSARKRWAASAHCPAAFNQAPKALSEQLGGCVGRTRNI